MISSGKLGFSERVTESFSLQSLRADKVVVDSSLGWVLWASEIKKTMSLLSRHLLSREEHTHGQIRMECYIHSLVVL